VDTVAALEALQDSSRTEFLCELGIFTRREIESRFNVGLERYIKTVELEADTVLELLHTYALPAGERQLETSAAAGEAIRKAGVDSGPALSRAGVIARAVAAVAETAHALKQSIEKADGIHDEMKRARVLADEVRPAMAAARTAADQLEHLVDAEIWSLPRYREMLFVR
jgi:glutamine synthetase